MFASLEEERAFYSRKAEQFKSKLTNQVDEFKSEYSEKAKNGVIIGGAVIASTILMRVLTGSKSKWVESDHGPVRIKKKESLLWSLVKGAAVVGIGYMAKDRVIEYISQNTNSENEVGSPAPYPAEPHTEL